MEKPDLDAADRRPVWDAMQMLFMDTDPVDELAWIARVCVESKYSVDELESILFDEVFPACRSNLLALPIPEWSGFEINELTQRILKKHRHGRSRLRYLKSEVQVLWQQLESRISKMNTASDC